VVYNDATDRLLRMSISLRPFRPEDQEFLFKLYAGTRQQEISAWGWSSAQQAAFLRMQFNARQHSYEMTHEGTEHQIVMLDDNPIGRIMVLRKPEGVLLVDIALFPEYRGRGIGGGLVRELIEQCNKGKVAVRLQVLKTNPAQRLYERLGFLKIGEDELYFQMERPAD
jgi:ribosomal protein S18 acetylase RimI-like enzyme